MNEDKILKSVEIIDSSLAKIILCLDGMLDTIQDTFDFNDIEFTIEDEYFKIMDALKLISKAVKESKEV